LKLWQWLNWLPKESKICLVIEKNTGLLELANYLNNYFGDKNGKTKKEKIKYLNIKEWLAMAVKFFRGSNYSTT